MESDYGLSGTRILREPLGGCPRIEGLLRESGFRPIFPIKRVKYSKYSPHLIEKMASKPLSLATTPIFGQPPGFLNHQLSAENRERLPILNQSIVKLFSPWISR